MKKPKLGSGKRFSSFVNKLESGKQHYTHEQAQAIAADAGRHAHGQKAMTRYSKMGMKKKK